MRQQCIGETRSRGVDVWGGGWPESACARCRTSCLFVGGVVFVALRRVAADGNIHSHSHGCARRRAWWWCAKSVRVCVRVCVLPLYVHYMRLADTLQMHTNIRWREARRGYFRGPCAEGTPELGATPLSTVGYIYNVVFRNSGAALLPFISILKSNTMHIITQFDWDASIAFVWLGKTGGLYCVLWGTLFKHSRTPKQNPINIFWFECLGLV